MSALPVDDEEIWAPIQGAPGYEVSTWGRVRSWRAGHGQQPPPRYLAPTEQAKGYQSVGLSVDGRRRTVRVHRLVGEAFLGPLPQGMHTRHLDGDPRNNALSNLAYGTPSDNIQDQVRHGRHREARKSTCDKGHPLEGDNLLIRPDGARRCRLCAKIRRHRYWKEMGK